MSPGMITRRHFVAASTAALGGFTATASGYFANETINVGAIGVGGRAIALLSALRKLNGVRLTAVCDVWDQRVFAGAKIAAPGAFQTARWQEILDRKDLDAVVIATPDHWHSPLTISACEAGKDVYVEKPLTHDLSEGQKVIEAKNKTKRVVQVGMQQRSMPQYQEGKKIVASGKIGTVRKVHLTWNRNVGRGLETVSDTPPKGIDWKTFVGPAREQPFHPYRFRHWRWFWDFGGGILTDLMVHQLDIANWILGLQAPSTALAIGDNYQTQGLWETADTMQTLLTYPDKGVQVYFEGTFVNARNAAMIEIMGTEGTLYLDRGRYEIHPERGAFPYEENVIGEGARGRDFYAKPEGERLHLANWLESIRSRRDPIAPVEAGVAAAWGAHLGNRAFRSGQVAHWQSS